MIDRAVAEALEGMIRETETNFDANDLKPLERWAKNLYLHFDIQTATAVIDFVDEVYAETAKIVYTMVKKTVYNAIATHLGVSRKRSELTNLCQRSLDRKIREKASEIAEALYNRGEIKSIAAMNMEAALFRANDLAHNYLMRRRKDLCKGLRMPNAVRLSEEMNRLHENAMNYFYRQALATLQEAEESAKQQVRDQYPSSYRNLLQEQSFHTEMKGWIHYHVLPEINTLSMNAN